MHRSKSPYLITSSALASSEVGTAKSLAALRRYANENANSWVAKPSQAVQYRRD